MATTHPSQAKAQAAIHGVLLAVTAGHLINDTLQALLLSIYPMLRDLHSLSFAQVGFITLAFQATASVLQPLVGLYTDRRPIPFSLPVAPALTLVGLVVLALAGSYAMILLGAALIGVGSSIFHPEASRLARLSSGGRFGYAQSLFQLGGNFGTSIGPLLAAFVVVPYGQASLSWFTALALVSVAVLSYAASWYARHLSPAGGGRQVPKAPQPLPQRVIVTSLVILLCLMFSKFVYTSSLSSFYTRPRSTSSSISRPLRREQCWAAPLATGSGARR